MFWSHSPTFPDWGIFYDDPPDKMYWRQDAIGTPFLTADFGNQRVGIGTASPGQQLSVNGTFGIWAANRASFYTDQGSTLRGYVGPGRNTDLTLISKSPNWLRIGANNSLISFWANGGADVDDSPQMYLSTVCLYAFGFNLACSSDERLKKNIVPFAPVLDKVVQLQPVYFDWRADEFPERGLSSVRTSGLIAQQAEKVLPELVSTDEKGYRAVNYSELPLLTLEAIRELKVQNDALEQRVEALETLLRERLGVELSEARQ